MRDPVPINRNLVDQIADARAEVAAAGKQLTERANDVFRATSLIVLETVDQRLEAIVHEAQIFGIRLDERDALQTRILRGLLEREVMELNAA